MTDLAKLANSMPSKTGSATTIVARLTGLVRKVEARRQTRIALARLDAHLLRDVGIDPASAQHECSRHFWQD